MAQQLRALAILADYLSSDPSTYIKGSQLHVTPVPENLTPSSTLTGTACLQCTYTQAGTHISKNKLKKRKIERIEWIKRNICGISLIYVWVEVQSFCCCEETT